MSPPEMKASPFPQRPPDATLGTGAANAANSRARSVRRLAPIGFALILALLLPPVLEGWLGLGSFNIFLLAGVGIFVIAAVGQQILTGQAGQPCLGNAAFFGVGAYSTAILLTRYALSPWLALPLSLAASAAAGVLAGLPALRVRGPYLAVASLALVFITQDLLSQYETQQLQATTLSLARPAALASDTAFYYFTLGAMVLALIVAGNLSRGRTGRALRALRDGEAAAEMLGVPLGRTRTFAFVLSATITGLAGALQALRLGSVASSGFGLELSVLLLGMVVVGGAGSLTGAVLGGCLIAGLDDLLRYKLPSTVGPIEVAAAAPIVYSLLIIGTIALFPDGIAGALPRRWTGLEGR